MFTVPPCLTFRNSADIPHNVSFLYVLLFHIFTNVRLFLPIKLFNNAVLIYNIVLNKYQSEYTFPIKNGYLLCSQSALLHSPVLLTVILFEAKQLYIFHLHFSFTQPNKNKIFPPTPILGWGIKTLCEFNNLFHNPVTSEWPVTSH